MAFNGFAQPQSQNPAMGNYLSILTGNPFHLHSPPAPIVISPPPRPTDAIFLTGIASVVRPATALMVRRAPGAREMDYLALKTGESENGIQVVAIDETAGRVALIVDGVERVISFKTDSLPGDQPKPASIAPPKR
jgi:hypothetical protein